MRDRLSAALGRSAADYTDIRFTRRHRVVLVLRDDHLEAATTAVDEVGVVRCLSRGFAWGTASFGAARGVDAAVQLAHELSLRLPQPKPIDLAPVPHREEEVVCPAGRDPRRIPLSTKRHLLDTMGRLLREADRRVVEVRGRYTDEVRESWLVTSEGSVLYEERPAIALAGLAVAEEEGSTERGHDSLSVPGSWDDVEQWVEGTGRIAERAVSRLHTAPVKAARLPVVLDPRTAGLLAHRAIGHRCHGDGEPEPVVPLAIGTRIGADFLTIGDDGTALGLRGTLAFDHEGVVPQNTPLVRHGVLVGHLHTRASATGSGVAPTGNARGVADQPPTARLTNTYVANGTGTLEDLLRGVTEGVYLTEPRSAVLDRGRLTIEAGTARMIRRGELAEPVKEIALSGDALGLFGLIDAVAGDFQWDRSASRCLRMGGDELPVSVGAPHVRLVEAPVGVSR